LRGVLIPHGEVDGATANKINNLFFEVLTPPSYTEAARHILQTQKNRIILRRKEVKLPTQQFKTLLNGVILQDKDNTVETPELMTAVTEVKPTKEQLEDLYFANKIVKHTKSNTIVFAKDGTLIASGVGQTSRVDALKQAIEKAQSFGFEIKGSVMASDAFFPFPDC